MGGEIQYPIDDMAATARELRTLVEAQWAQHDALFRGNPDSYRALLTAIARAIPEAGGRVQQLEFVIDGYHQQYRAAYDALTELSDQIERAAEAMRLADQTIARSADSG